MSTTLRMPPRFPVGTPGQPWGEAERVQWRAMQSVKRSYHDEVLVKIDQMRGDFDVVQYGSLSQDPARYPLFALATKNWDASKPYVLITGGVHGYETSGVQGALQFLKTKAIDYSKTFNILVAPCVSPWGYECIQRWTINAIDPNRMFFAEGVSEEATAILNHVNSLGVAQWMCHFDLHETTDSDEMEFTPAKAARDGLEPGPDPIPDGFYLVGDINNPQLEWHGAMIDAVEQVTHIAPPDHNNCLVGDPVVQKGIIVCDTKEVHLCSSMTNAHYATTTEVYPDSSRTTPQICNDAQVACISGGLDFVIKTRLSQ